MNDVDAFRDPVEDFYLYIPGVRINSALYVNVLARYICNDDFFWFKLFGKRDREGLIEGHWVYGETIGRQSRDADRLAVHSGFIGADVLDHIIVVTRQG